MRLYRMHLKTEPESQGGSRKELISYCLGSAEPVLAVGWSYLHERNTKIGSIKELLSAYNNEIALSAFLADLAHHYMKVN